MMGDPVLGTATPADTADNTPRGHTQNNASISGPGDDDVADGSVAVATDVTAGTSDVITDNTSRCVVNTGDTANDTIITDH